MGEFDWRPIPELAPYEVTSDGRTRNGTTGRVLVQRPTESGYLAIYPIIEGSPKRKFVHRLVLLAFVGPPLAGQMTRHLDGCKQNNHLSNLAWGTNSENQRDRVRHGKDPNASKTHCKRGHEFTPENTYQRPNGRWRMCRTCQAARPRAETPHVECEICGREIWATNRARHLRTHAGQVTS